MAADSQTTARNAVAERLEPLVDFYIERGDGDERTVMLIEALGEIDHLHTALQRSTIQKQDWRSISEAPTNGRAVWVTGGSDGYIVRARNYGDTPWGWTDQYADTIEPSKAEWFLPDEAIETP
jgi:hypothetical protein